MKQESKAIIDDKNIEIFIGRFLRLGTLVSCGVALVGGLLYLVSNGMQQMPDYGTFHGEEAGYTSLPGIIKGLSSGSAREIIQLGVCILIATPILRIVLSLISFMLEKDKMYVVITLIVLCIILTSMFGGLKV
ncbi:Uncharacterized membrane protein [Filimonas lacunae]|uniref:Uncharacterized membrane protein n=1 Tax=Filimonas lacunae TaxID=477680 RepID=A0A173ML92_9BACT|nr:DUF1634 domain-containing protein [Filimonas lacunae]BAV08374.1 hypothetical protein FLA_4410 [Filimonas lacunae]SIT33469.1 Uncharacterized membrane protein [Filimonas lacunae]